MLSPECQPYRFARVSFICMREIIHPSVSPPLIKPASFFFFLPQLGAEMHHRCTVSDETPKTPACSGTSLIQRDPLRYCESIIFSLHGSLQFVTSSLAILPLFFSSSPSPQLPHNPFNVSPPSITFLLLLPVHSPSLSDLIFLLWSEQVRL